MTNKKLRKLAKSRDKAGVGRKLVLSNALDGGGERFQKKTNYNLGNATQKECLAETEHAFK